MKNAYTPTQEQDSLPGKLGSRFLTAILPALTPGLASVGRRLPRPFVSAHFVVALEGARHMHWLVPPPQLDGRSFTIRIEDLGLYVSFTCRQGRFRPLWNPVPTTDLDISARLADFASLARGTTDADTLFFQRRLKIAGDIDLGLIVKNWLDAMERPAWLTHTGQGFGG
ncbi:MAG: hypothetical protein JWM03_1800 [Rhodocyclales bacterium]|nr:hypothetical protein [Rhodocyclales bacterium]